jgi:gas vesicle protein
MRRLFSFFGGLLSGGIIGTAIALLFTPESGDSMRQGLRQRYANALQAGEGAAHRKRQELEARLVEVTTPPLDSPATESGAEL